MSNKTKRVCQFPGCTTQLPRSHGGRPKKYCITHYNQVKHGWTHQTALGILPVAMLKELEEDGNRN